MGRVAETINGYRLPEWLSPLVALTRPLAVTMVIAIPAVGSASVGIASIFDARIAEAMARNSIIFIAGIPEAAWWVIASIALGYFGSKSAEVIKAPPPPAGRASPEGAATRGESEAVAPPVDPSIFDEDAPPPQIAGAGVATPELKL